MIFTFFQLSQSLRSSEKYKIAREQILVSVCSTLWAERSGRVLQGVLGSRTQCKITRAAPAAAFPHNWNNTVSVGLARLQRYGWPREEDMQPFLGLAD